ncbi:hypothetical protein G6F56_003028 [Rhizopus delemar]|nr:hypothetical protein G6F56_003028 [Rhizopus delemar]
MQRAANSTLAFPISETWPLPENVISNYIKPDTPLIPWNNTPSAQNFARFMLSSPSYLLSEYEKDHQELDEAMSDAVGWGSTEELPFIEQSKKRVAQEKKRIRHQKTQDMDLALSTLDMMFEAVAKYSKKQGKERAEPVVQLEKDIPEAYRQLHTTTTPTKQMKAQQSATSDFYFYQEKEGQHVYLHPLDIRILKHEFGSYDQFPLQLQVQVINVQESTLDEDLRKKCKYLGHLPLACDVTFLEINVKDIVSSDTLQTFKNELHTRTQRRKDKERREDQEKKNAENKQKLQIEKDRDNERKRMENDPFFTMYQRPDDEEEQLARAMSESLITQEDNGTGPRTVWGTRQVSNREEELKMSHDDWADHVVKKDKSKEPAKDAEQKLAKDVVQSKLLELLVCGICLDTFKDPHTIDCGHNYCGECLLAWFEQSRICPSCNNPSTRPPIANHTLNNIVSQCTDQDNAKRLTNEDWREINARNNPATVVFDSDDDVARCATCLWELNEENICERCDTQHMGNRRPMGTDLSDDVRSHSSQDTNLTDFVVSDDQDLEFDDESTQEHDVSSGEEDDNLQENYRSFFDDEASEDESVEGEGNQNNSIVISSNDEGSDSSQILLGGNNSDDENNSESESDDEVVVRRNKKITINDDSDEDSDDDSDDEENRIQNQSRSTVIDDSSDENTSSSVENSSDDENGEGSKDARQHIILNDSDEGTLNSDEDSNEEVTHINTVNDSSDENASNNFNLDNSSDAESGDEALKQGILLSDTDTTNSDIHHTDTSNYESANDDSVINNISEKEGSDDESIRRARVVDDSSSNESSDEDDVPDYDFGAPSSPAPQPESSSKKHKSKKRKHHHKDKKGKQHQQDKKKRVKTKH